MHKMEKCKVCGREVFSDIVGKKCHGCGKLVDECSCEKLEEEKLADLVHFKLVDKPKIVTKSKFPYEKVIETCRVMPAEKSIPFKEEELSGYHIHKLRKYMSEQGLDLRYLHDKKERMYFIWANKV